jgi:hypothetical protein
MLPAMILQKRQFIARTVYRNGDVLAYRIERVFERKAQKLKFMQHSRAGAEKRGRARYFLLIK